MTRATFRTTRRFMAPGWLTEGEGGLVGYSLDLVKDAYLERLRQGHLARYPQQDPTGESTAPDDALASIGRDRGIERGIEETPQSYARRLRAWLDDHKRKGNPFELMHQLAGYVNDPVAHFRTVDVRGNWFSRAADGTETAQLSEGNWNWDGTPYTRLGRFWVIIYPGSRWEPLPTFGSLPVLGTPDMTIGTTATPEQVATTKTIVNEWKPAGTKCIAIIVAFDESSFDPNAPEPDGLWGRHSREVTVGVRTKSRLATARYWPGGL